MSPQPQLDVDVLTGLLTGAHMDSFTLATWESATAGAGALSVMLLELDDFERYCDNYGPEAGEVLLRRMSAVIRASGLSKRATGPDAWLARSS